jgi:hypothetical protein
MDPETADPGGGGDTVVTDRQLFDSAINDPAPQPEPSAPSPEARGPEPSVQQQSPQQPPPQQGQPQPGQTRDAQGRFTPQRPQQGAPPPPRGQVQGQGQPQQQHQVPLRELLDERERRYRVQAEHDQMRQAWNNLQQQAMQQQELARQQQMPKTIYDNPEQYLQHNVMQPLRNEGHMAMLQIKDGLSREMANAQFGEQNVSQALNALASFRYTPNGDHLFRQIMSSGHPYGALVRWFHSARTQQQIGPDPNAWVQKQRQAWLDDEQMQTEAARRYYARQQQRQPQRAQGQSPNVRLPPSLSSLPSSSGRQDEVGDMSDASLWRAALR